MKIVFDEDDNKLIEEMKNTQSPMIIPEDIDQDKVLSINFKIIDPYKASLFIGNLLYDRNKKYQEDTGIDLTSINYYKAICLNGIKDSLQELLDSMSE